MLTIVALFLFGGLRCCSGLTTKVAIVGAGPGGLTLASLLSPSKFSVDIYDRAQDARKTKVGGGLQLTSGATLLRDAAGIDVSRNALELERVVSRDRFGNTVLELDVAESLREAGLGPGYAIMRDALQQLLCDASPEVITGHTLTSARQTASKVFLEFNDCGEEKEYDLVVGCDGVGSAVERLLFDGGGEKQYTGVKVLFCVSDDVQDDRRGTKFEQFLGSGAYCLRARYGSVRPGESTQMVAVCFGSNKAGEEARWSNEGEVKTLAEATVNRAGLDSFVDLSSATRFYQASVFARSPRIRSWSNGRVVLCGDSAHAMPPFLGQGANQAISDAVSLARQLDSTRDYQSAFSSYHAKRIFPTTRLQLNSRILGAIETQESSAGCAFRDAFFGVTGKLGVAKQVFLDGATPRL